MVFDSDDASAHDYSSYPAKPGKRGQRARHVVVGVELGLKGYDAQVTCVCGLRIYVGDWQETPKGWDAEGWECGMEAVRLLRQTPIRDRWPDQPYLNDLLAEFHDDSWVIRYGATYLGEDANLPKGLTESEIRKDVAEWLQGGLEEMRWAAANDIACLSRPRRNRVDLTRPGAVSQVSVTLFTWSQQEHAEAVITQIAKSLRTRKLPARGWRPGAPAKKPAQKTSR